MSNQSTIENTDRFAGQQFLLTFFHLIKTAKVHQDNNSILIRTLFNFRIAIKHLFKDQNKVEFIVHEGLFYLNGQKLNYQNKMAVHIRNFGIFFEEHWIDGICLYPEIMSATNETILSLVRAINSSIKHENPNEWLTNTLSDPDHEWVEIIDSSQTESITAFIGDEIRRPTPTKEDTSAQSTDDKKKKPSKKERERQAPSKELEETVKKKAMVIYGNAMGALREISQVLSSKKETGIGQSVRLVQGMVNMIIQDDYVLLGLSTLRDYDDYTFIHSVNVSILSIHLGHRIGLSRLSLEQLGLGALFHDLGKIDIATEILNKPGELSGQEFTELKKHSINSVGRIIRLRTASEKKAKIITAPFEHHLKYNLTGYPQTPRKRPLSLFGRIVAIADTYDAITSPRIYRKATLSPDRALGLMCKGAGKDFDPILLKVFINMMGVYPIGTVLKLKTGKFGITAGYTSDEDESEKILHLLLLKPLPDGGYEKGELIDFGTFNQETGQYSEEILGSFHPSEFGIQPAEFFYKSD